MQLMERLFDFASNWQGIERLDLGVAIKNTAAIALYEKLGFQLYGIDLKAMKENDQYIDEQLMVKFL